MPMEKLTDSENIIISIILWLILKPLPLKTHSDDSKDLIDDTMVLCKIKKCNESSSSIKQSIVE